MEYGCIGEKLSHSFSAEIHSRLFDYKYELKEISKGELDGFMRQKSFKAINVTIPYKQDVIPYLDYIDDTARDIGAVNTVVNKNGKLYGYNTDFSGMKALLERGKIDLSGKNVLILGSGGTSKTAMAVAKDMGAAKAQRVSRSGKDGCITYDEAYNEDAQIIINTTPCGMFPNIGGAAIDIDRFCRLSGVADAVYNPLSTELILRAKKRCIKAVGGLYMLVAQAAFAAEKFVGTPVSKQKTDEIYRELLLSKRNIVLIGMPSSGKTTVGGVLANRLNRELIDTDSEIVKTAGKFIHEIFAESSEAGFRDIEAKVIKSLSAKQGVVIATGGGAVLREENIEFLKSNGKIYFLDRPLNMLVTTDDRPLSSNRADLERRYNERYELYRKSADCIIDGAPDILAVANFVLEDFSGEDFSG